MKKTLFLLLLITGLNATAQTERAFFTRDSASMINIAKLVLENATNKYHFEKVYPRRTSAEIWYRNDSQKSVVVRVVFQFLPDSSGWMLTHVTGPIDDILPFWKKYFDADAVVAEKQRAREIKYISTPFLKGKAMYYFNNKIVNQSGEIVGGYVPDRIKKN